ncbi:MAG: phosphomannomutase [archaeon]|nr:phosphomannomutase [archaeon]
MDGQSRQTNGTTKSNNMTPEKAMEMGVKFGIAYDSIAVIRDSDPSSMMISQSLISGLLSAGARVIDAGIVPVPVAHVALSSQCRLLMSVGNPDTDGRFCGINVFDHDGTPLTEDQILETLRRKEYELPDYRNIGQLVQYNESSERYIQKVKSLNVSSQGYVILDCGCGSTSICGPQLLESIGADTVAFNTHKCNGRLPRAPGLQKTNLMNISNFVNASIGSIGVAFNGDGTRLALMDESGKYVPGDRLLALLLMYLQPNVAVIPFDSPCVVEDAFMHPLGMRDAEDAGERRLIRTQNNLGSIIDAMKENNADFGALNDGTFIFPQIGYCPDALFACTIISELAGKRSIRNVLEEIPLYSNRTLRIEFDGNLKLFNNKLSEKIKDYDVSEVCFSGESWKMILKKGTYIIKQSPTDPSKLTVFAESYDVIYLITMLEQARDIIRACI